MTTTTTTKTQTTINSFNLTAVENSINKTLEEIIGVNPNIKVNAEDPSKYEAILISSDDLIVDVIPRMFKSLHIVSWGSTINADGNLLVKLDYSYTHFDGGSNGFSVADIWLDVDGNVVDVRNCLEK
jgi:hypothetical protein